MKKYILLGFSMVFMLLFAVSFDSATIDGIYFPAYKAKVKPPMEERIEAQAKIRSAMLTNLDNGKVNTSDWYEAWEKVNKMNNQISSRAGSIDWQEGGPLDVGGRSRSFIFDNQNPKRCFVGSVSGGIFESNDNGYTWAPVKGLDKFPIMSIGCMSQSINGDIYAGTGEYWGNPVNGSYGSQFNGNGIYKRDAITGEWVLLPSTFSTPVLGTNLYNFSVVIDIACDPADNNKVFAATDKGLFVSKDAGNTWNKVSGIMSSGAISQIKASANASIWYAGRDGIAYKSTDGGTNWTAITSGAYIADAQSQRRHMRIAVSKQDPNKVYVCGINSSGQLKFTIKSLNGGTSWELLGKQDALLYPLCSADGTACQGWYDLCMAVNPKNDDQLFLGGQQALYTWSPATNWVKAAFWNSPAKLGLNEVHADMHELVFDSNRPDTLAICTDGGIYMTLNASSKFPNPTWLPRNKGYNVTQFYDIATSIYGEMLGGAQDNGTNLVRTDASSTTKSLDVSGGDGFNSAISANNDSRVMFYTVYNGAVYRSENMNANLSSVVTKLSCIDLAPRTQTGAAQGDGNADNVGFFTKIHVAEKLIPDPNNTNDTVNKEIPEKSLMFIMNEQGFYVSHNATTPGQTPLWTSNISAQVGEPMEIHETKDLSIIYVVGTGGARKITGFDKTVFAENKASSNGPCLLSNITTDLKINITPLSGVPSSSIGNVYVRQSSPVVKPEVLMTQYGFGGTAKVFYSTDGNSFTAKQGNLPLIPVYCGVIDELDPKHVIIGTEFGVYETDDITAASVKWVASNTNIGSVPVFRMRQMKLRKDGCWMVYLATHGRGFFYAPINKVDGCSYNLNRPKDVSSGIDPFVNFENKFSVFPNPTTDVLNVRFKSTNTQYYSVSVYNQMGQFVKKMTYKAAYGINTMPPIDVSMLAKGNYFVRLEDEQKVVGGAKFIVK